MILLDNAAIFDSLGRMGSKLLAARRPAVAIVLLLCAAFLAAPPRAVAGQTFTFTGGSTDLWSLPANWVGGVVPVSGDDNAILSAGGINDLTELRVGTLQLRPGYTYGNALAVSREVRASDNATLGFGSQSYLPVTLVGDVTLRTPGFSEQIGSIAPVLLYLDSATGGGSLGVDGLVRLGDGAPGGGGQTLPPYRGDVRVRPGSVLGGGGHIDGSVRNEGLLDYSGTITGNLDSRGGVFRANRNAGTLGGALASGTAVGGDVTLNEWQIDGRGGFGDVSPFLLPLPIDRLDVGGVLDLTGATLTVPQPASNPQVEWDGVTPLPAYFTLATYGSRVGALAQGTLPITIFLPDPSPPFPNDRIQIAGRIVYTSGENAGPGEIRVLIPEPSTAGLLAAGLGLLRRRNL